MRPTWRGAVGVGRSAPSVALLPRPLTACIWVHGGAWEDERQVLEPGWRGLGERAWAAGLSYHTGQELT